MAADTRVNTVRTCEIKFAAGGRLEEKETGRRGLQRSKEARQGDLIGAECANDTEPYVICEVLRELKVWTGAPGRSWMGTIKDGDEYLTLKKYERRKSDVLYAETDREFYLLAADCHIIFRNHSEMQRARQSQRSAHGAVKLYVLAQDEIDILKNRVYIRHRDGNLIN